MSMKMETHRSALGENLLAFSVRISQQLKKVIKINERHFQS